MKVTVTVLDTTGIQPYIFGSNRLRENIGASHLVSQATGAWVEEILDKDFGVIQKRQSEPIETSGLDAELIYAGGGNTVLLFRASDDPSVENLAVRFTKILSKKVLKEAPGINLIVAHSKPFEWQPDAIDSLYDTIQKLMKHDLDAKKRGRVPSSPLLGLSVTAVCQSTQLIAIGESEKFEDDEPYLISREVQKKLATVSEANQELRTKFLKSDLAKKYSFPLRTDHMGRSSGESSYVAVIHADGNRMGRRFQEFGKSKRNREYITDMRKLSDSVNEAGICALSNVIEKLIASIQEVEEDGKVVKKIKGGFALKENYLPVRPLVYGGDDATFVCEGRLGLEVAAMYLKELEKRPIADGKPLRACAGICIVKTHYPFSRAYDFSKALCKSAKKYVKEKDVGDLSALDWHLAASGLIGSISDIREREYKVPAGDLAMRPVLLQEQGNEWRTWIGFTKVIREFLKDGWQDRQNKVMALREVLRRGPEATKEFLIAYRLESLPIFPDAVGKRRNQFAKDGWSTPTGDTCCYFDAIEALDFYIGLGEESNDQVSTEDQVTE